MAIVHISEADAVRDFADLLAKVRAGEEIRIDSDTATVAILHAPDHPVQKKTLTEAIRLAELRGSSVTLDDNYSRDLDTVISNHEHEGTRNPWAD